MKSYNKIKCIVLILIISLLSVTACSKDSEETSKTSQSSKENSNSSSEPTLEPTPEPTPEPKNPNVLELSGYEYYDNEVEKEQQDIYLAALYSAKTADKDDIIDYITVFGVSDDTITVDCALRVGNGKDDENSLEYTLNHKIVALDKETLKLKKEITVDGNEFFIENKNEVFVLNSIADHSTRGIIYDYDLNIVGEYNLQDYDSVFVNGNGKTVYAIKNKTIIKYDVTTGEISNIHFNENCLVEFINGVITAKDTDYVMASVIFEDFNSHQAIMDVQSKEILYICNDTDGYSSMDNNIYYTCKYDEMGIGSWVIAADEETQWEYTGKENDMYFSQILLDNGDVMFTTTKDDVVIMEVYDNELGTLIDRQEIKVPCSEIEPGAYDGETPYRANVVDVPKYLDEDTLLVTINNIDSEMRFYIWNFDDEEDTGSINVEKYVTGTNPSCEIVPREDITLYTPGELSAELLPLKEKADAMEEKYGVEIYIGEECGNYAGGYSSAPYIGYENVEYALEKFEYALSKYPEGFFKQFDDSYNKGLHVYLAGELRGVADDVLDLAGGFKDTENSKIILYINCDFSHMIESTFHHELCHAIDEKIINADLERETPLLSDEVWGALNPMPDMYTFTYDEYGFDDNYKYVYDIGMYDSLSDVYFIDSYAMTYPTEDRARIFEAIMGDIYMIDFETTPHLQEKITYFSECMRQTFDTTGWEDVHWERYNKK